MFPYAQPTIFQQPVVTSSGPLHSHLRSTDIHLNLRQEPQEALVCTDGKEKARKPVDPPPIIQVTVKQAADPPQNFLQSPYLFMCASLWKMDKDEAWDGDANRSLAGSLVSSLHRLKDTDNKDGGFFVFGDISVKVQGNFRLHFSLFDLHKETNEVQYLGAITSKPFRVLLPKDFKGMEESTYLSRAFSDQGVRLRLRKEPRAMMGNKRPYSYGMESPVSNAPIRPNLNEYSSYDDSSSPNKRFRGAGTEDRKEHFGDTSGVSGAAFSSSFAPSISSQYAARMPSITSTYSMSQYPTFGAMTTGSTAPYQLDRVGATTSTHFPNSQLHTSGPSTMSGTMGTHRFAEHQQAYGDSMFIFGQSRGTGSSSATFQDDGAGLGGYRTGPSAGIGDGSRPTTTLGIPQTMAHQNPQPQIPHHAQDSIGSNRGASYSTSPVITRHATSGHLLGTHQSHPPRSAGRFDDQSQIQSGLYQTQRNTLQVPPTESSLTSDTDTGVPPSVQFQPDLSQSSYEHVADNQ